MSENDATRFARHHSSSLSGEDRQFCSVERIREIFVETYRIADQAENIDGDLLYPAVVDFVENVSCANFVAAKYSEVVLQLDI